MANKKEKLLITQQELIKLEHLLVDISEAKRKRDVLFRQIVVDLGKLMRKDYWKQYEEWCQSVFDTKGIIEPEEAIEWLRSIFQQCADKLK